MKIAAVFVLLGVVAMINAKEDNMKMVKLPQDMLNEDGMPLIEMPEARDELRTTMNVTPDQMQRRGGGGKGKGEGPPPPPPPPMGWGMPMGGWGAPPMPPPMLGWGMGGPGGFPGGYGRR